MTQTKKAPDWERIENDYRAGLLSVREIAASQGVSHTAIGKRAKTHGWERDLQAKIKAKSDALVAKREVAKQVATEQVVTDRLIVDANAQVIADIRIGHRTDIARSRKLAMSLLEELEVQTDSIGLLEDLQDALQASDEGASDRQHQIFQRVISSAGRIDSMKKLSDTLKTLIGMEREAYGIDVDAGEDNQVPAGLNHFYGNSETDA